MPDQNSIPAPPPGFAPIQSAPPPPPGFAPVADAPQAAPTQPQTAGDLGLATHRFDPSTNKIVPVTQSLPSMGGTPLPPGLQGPNQATGVAAGVKRNTVGAIEGLYHAFNDPATEQEKAEILQKIRAENSKYANAPALAQGQPKISESVAANPPRAMLALHRIIDAPADVLQKKGRDEVGVAQDLINHHEYWKGGNLYLSGLTDKLLSKVPLAGAAINSTAERAESGDVSGAATDVAAALALENAPAIARGTGKVAGRTAEAVGEAAGQIPAKVSNTAEAIKPEWLTKREPTPAPQHGAPVNVESPLDSATISKQVGGKDLSKEAMQAVQAHVGDTIPVGGSAKNSLMKAVEPTVAKINDLSSKINKVVNDAPNFTTSAMQDAGLGGGKFLDDIEAIKKNLPASDAEKLTKDVEGVMKDADEALNSTDPPAVLKFRRALGNQIDWSDVSKNPSTPVEVTNSTRARVYRALTNKIHSEVPESVAIDKQLGPQLELRSHMLNKLGERVTSDPLAATEEASAEFKKGKAQVEATEHNARVQRNWQIVKAGLIAAGISSGLLANMNHIFNE